MKTIDTKNLDQAFAKGDIKASCESVWEMTHFFVGQRMPDDHALRERMIFLIANSICKNLSSEGLRKVRTPINFVDKAIRNAYTEQTQHLADTRF